MTAPNKHLSLLLPLAALTLSAACGVSDAELSEGAPPDEELASTGGQALVSCNQRTDTGYSNGQAFAITVVSADGEPIDVNGRQPGDGDVERDHEPRRRGLDWDLHDRGRGPVVYRLAVCELFTDTGERGGRRRLRVSDHRAGRGQLSIPIVPRRRPYEAGDGQHLHGHVGTTSGRQCTR